MTRPLPLPLNERIQKFFKVEKHEWLPGDASNRQYVRLWTNERSLILMILNAAEAFKSEEVTGADESKLKDLPFVVIDRALEAGGARVPKILAVDEKNEFIVLEDLGDRLLYDLTHESIPMDWYERALEELARFRKIPAFLPAKDRRFTHELLSWEAEHFVEWAIEKREKRISEAGLKTLRQFLEKIVVRMESSRYGLTHRDYHSKNIMILDNENRVGLIDFQDALMGPPTYDLASFLRDSYVRLTNEQENSLIATYEKLTGESVDRELYAMTSLQRNLKAIGRFHYIHLVKGRATHLPYVPSSLRRVYQTLSDLNEMGIKDLLLNTLAGEERET